MKRIKHIQANRMHFIGDTFGLPFLQDTSLSTASIIPPRMRGSRCSHLGPLFDFLIYLVHKIRVLSL